MADTKISALPAATAAVSADEIPVNEAGTSKKVTALQLNSLTDVHRFRFAWMNGPTPPNVTNVGSGSCLANATRGITLATGATNPSSTSFRGNLEASGGVSVGGIISKVRRIEFQTWLADVFANANSYLYLTDESVNTVPSGTARHFGIKNLNGVISFTTADGTTEQLTTITTFFVAATGANVVIEFDGTTALCYIDGVLRATHATNVPAAGGAAVLRGFLNNNSTVNSRSMVVYEVDALFAA